MTTSHIGRAINGFHACIDDLPCYARNSPGLHYIVTAPENNLRIRTHALIMGDYPHDRKSLSLQLGSKCVRLRPLVVACYVNVDKRLIRTSRSRLTGRRSSNAVCGSLWVGATVGSDGQGPSDRRSANTCRPAMMAASTSGCMALDARARTPGVRSGGAQRQIRRV